MSTKKTSSKYLAVITYCIALVCLLLGLFLPLYNGNGLLFMALPSAFCKMFGIDGSVGEELSREFILNFGTGEGYDIIPLLVLLYALITAAGVIMLIPVLACKAKKKGANVCAYIIEVAAGIVLFVYTLIQMIAYSDFLNAGEGSFAWDYGLVAIAFGGVMLMLIIQSVGYKKSSGWVKFICAVLGMIAVTCLLDIPALFRLEKSEIFGGSFFVGYYNDIDGITTLNSFLTDGGAFFGPSGVKVFTGTVVGISAIIVLVNFAIDIIALATNTTKASLVVDIIRYAAEVVLLLISIVMLFVLNVQQLSPGLLMIVMFGAGVIQLIITSIRCGRYRPAKKREESTPAENAAIPVVQTVYAQPAYVQPAYIPATPVTAGGEIVYAPREVYRGPSDDFIAKLEESEKIEFAKTFLDKQKGPCPELPDYVVGGDNKEFFTSIFLYLGKYRSLISDGLMSKIYQELNVKKA